MQYVIVAHDGEGMLEKRMSVRPRHLANMAKVGETNRILCAGGLTDEAGNLRGSVLIVEFDTREELDAYLANEPYVVEKVWADIKVETMNVAIVNNARV